MPLRFTKVRGRPVGLYLALLGIGVTTEPSDVTITVDTGGAAAGATTVPITDPGTDIPKNSVITFSPASGDAFTVVVTEAFTSGSSGDLKVEAYEGAEDDGIPTALAAGDTATWDSLYTVTATENAPYTNNPQTQDLTAATYGSGSGVDVGEPEVTSVSPQIARSGLFIAEGQLVSDILEYADTNRNWWCKQVLPDANGEPWKSREGLSRVTDLNNEGPADGLLRLSFNIRFKQVPTLTTL